MSALIFMIKLIYGQWTTKLPEPKMSFAGKTIIVTGANQGLGFEAARHITRLGAEKVILAVRRTEAGEEAKKSIENNTGRTGVVEVWNLDLCSYDSVKAFADRAEKLPRLDVLLENAGLATAKFKIAEYDESTITTNVVSTYLLGLLLLPKLRETAKQFNTQPYLTIVSSEVHFLTKLPERNDKSGSIFDTLSDESKARMTDRYNVSKLLEVFATRQLVEERASSGYPVIINFMNPGFCHSGLMREVGSIQYVFKALAGARSTEVGAYTLVHAIAAGPESHGQYLSDCKVTSPAPFVLSEEGKKTQKRVWDELQARLVKIQPDILSKF